jgi:DNA-directed RNA polymerase specialized sigma24 family protein
LRFLAAFQSARALPDEAVCASWLISAMTNCFYDQLRRRRTQERGARDPAIARRTAPLPEDLSGLVPEPALRALRGCPEVAAYARPPLQGRVPPGGGGGIRPGEGDNT